MYPWIWRHLPGPTPVRAMIAAALVLSVVWVSFQWVFPAIAPYMPFNGSTVGD